jgi:hypothetical protein
MKLKIFAIIPFFIISNNIFAQNKGEKELIICNFNVNADTSIHYILVAFFNPWAAGNINTKQDVLIDIGRKDIFKECEFDMKLITDENGEKRKFNSIIEGLNYFYNRGWYLKNSWIGMGTTSQYNNFILERRD